MSSSGVNLENFRIPLEEIIRATENFSQERRIGDGGFGIVYRGQLSNQWQNRTAAIKRRDQDVDQGGLKFRTELDIISRCHHQNIITFLGYCHEGQEMIVVLDYCVNRSLDQHLRDPNKMCCITWTQRLKICIGVARGLNYLHSGVGEHNIVIHRDVKSANILLDENFMAKACDFGLSVLVSKNLPNAQLITEVAGTQFYLDPVYHESRILRKETDIYSFGVVLFEMLSGTLVYSTRTIEDDTKAMLMTSVRRHQTQPANLVDPNIKDQIHTRSLYRFTEMAYRCISLDLNNRPSIETVAEMLKEMKM